MKKSACATVSPIRSDYHRGFSLPELLVVFLAISILIVLALPGAIRSLQLYRLDTSVSVIGNKLTEARMSAIKRNRTVWLRLDKNSKTAQIRTTNTAGQTIDIGNPERFPQDLVLDASNSVEISFDSLGRSASGTQTFTLKEAGSSKRKTVTVSPAGKISVGQMY
jgi:prepilin-type N-terminal cleavage/methylation domain-containing protein